MAKRVFKTGGLTFTASAHGVQATSGAYMSLVGGSSTQITDVLEIKVTGKVTSSPTILATEMARQGTLGTGGATTLAAPHSDGPMSPATAALAAPVITAVAYTTNQVIPSNTVTDAKLDMGINALGGLLRWNASPFQQWQMIGNTASAGGSVLWNDASAGGVNAVADAHIIYETY